MGLIGSMLHFLFPKRSWKIKSHLRRQESSSDSEAEYSTVEPKSHARQFLDLTAEVEQKRTTSIHNNKLSTEQYVSNTSDNDDDDESCNDTDDEEENGAMYVTTSWEKADVALIQEVHELSDQLEEELCVRGMESPLWPVHEVIPNFKKLHTQIGKLIKEADNCENNEGDDSCSSLSLDILMDEFNEEEQRPIHLENILYTRLNCSRCSAPPSISSGFDRGTTPVEQTREILNELTCPLRDRRPLPPMVEESRNLARQLSNYYSERSLNIDYIYN